MSGHSYGKIIMRCEICDYEDRMEYDKVHGRVRQRGEIAGSYCQKCFTEIYYAISEDTLEEDAENLNPRPVPQLPE